jgi:hypothetical protein
MSEEQLLSPKVISFPPDAVWGTISHNAFAEKKMGIDMPVQYSAMMRLQKGDDGRYIIPIDPAVLFDKKLVAQISSVKQIVKQASESAERLFDHLRDLNARLCRIHGLAEERDKYLTRENRSFEKLDFMGHRYLLGEIMKSGKVTCIAAVIEQDKLKKFRKNLEQFILDRNKYTHGEVLFYVDESATILSYINHTTHQAEYGIIDDTILKSFFRSQEYFQFTFAKIFECVDKM